MKSEIKKNPFPLKHYSEERSFYDKVLRVTHGVLRDGYSPFSPTKPEMAKTAAISITVRMGTHNFRRQTLKRNTKKNHRRNLKKPK